MQTRCVCQDAEPPTPLSAVCITTTFCSAYCVLLPFLHRLTSVLLSLQPADIHCPQLHCSSTLITNFPVSGRQPCGHKTLLHSWSNCNILAYDAVHTSGWAETFRGDTAVTFLIMATLGRTQYTDNSFFERVEEFKHLKTNLTNQNFIH